ncbi:unnamed protein product [Amoebophrya sp. A120]|nr:unnamed protein product [Amoebophrya sp. A120]|eukprot:GSA120T00022254001.1
MKRIPVEDRGGPMMLLACRSFIQRYCVSLALSLLFTTSTQVFTTVLAVGREGDKQTGEAAKPKTVWQALKAAITDDRKRDRQGKFVPDPRTRIVGAKGEHVDALVVQARIQLQKIHNDVCPKIGGGFAEIKPDTAGGFFSRLFGSSDGSSTTTDETTSSPATTDGAEATANDENKATPTDDKASETTEATPPTPKDEEATPAPMPSDENKAATPTDEGRPDVSESVLELHHLRRKVEELQETRERTDKAQNSPGQASQEEQLPAYGLPRQYIAAGNDIGLNDWCTHAQSLAQKEKASDIYDDYSNGLKQDKEIDKKRRWGSSFGNTNRAEVDYRAQPYLRLLTRATCVYACDYLLDLDPGLRGYPKWPTTASRERVKLIDSCRCTMRATPVTKQVPRGHFRRTIYLIRHAESEWNARENQNEEEETTLTPSALWNDRDSPLTPQGVMQATLLGKVLSAGAAGEDEEDNASATFFDPPPQLVFTSPLLRTMLTSVLMFGKSKENAAGGPPSGKNSAGPGPGSSGAASSSTLQTGAAEDPAGTRNNLQGARSTATPQIIPWKNLLGYNGVESLPVTPASRLGNLLREALADAQLMAPREPAGEEDKLKKKAAEDERTAAYDGQLGLPISKELQTLRELFEGSASSDSGEGRAGKMSSKPLSVDEASLRKITSADTSPGFPCDRLHGDHQEPAVCHRLPEGERCKGFRAMRKLSPLWPMCASRGGEDTESEMDFGTRVLETFVALMLGGREEYDEMAGQTPPNAASADGVSSSSSFTERRRETVGREAAESEDKAAVETNEEEEDVTDLTWAAPYSLVAAVREKASDDEARKRILNLQNQPDLPKEIFEPTASEEEAKPGNKLKAPDLVGVMPKISPGALRTLPAEVAVGEADTLKLQKQKAPAAAGFSSAASASAIEVDATRSRSSLGSTGTAERGGAGGRQVRDSLDEEVATPVEESSAIKLSGKRSSIVNLDDVEDEDEDERFYGEHYRRKLQRDREDRARLSEGEGAAQVNEQREDEEVVKQPPGHHVHLGSRDALNKNSEGASDDASFTRPSSAALQLEVAVESARDKKATGMVAEDVDGVELEAVAMVTHGSTLDRIRGLILPFSFIQSGPAEVPGTFPVPRVPESNFPLEAVASSGQGGSRGGSSRKRQKRQRCGNEPGNALKIVLEWPMLATGENTDDVHANLVQIQSRMYGFSNDRRFFFNTIPHVLAPDPGGLRKSVRAFTGTGHALALDFLNVMHDAVYNGKKDFTNSKNSMAWFGNFWAKATLKDQRRAAVLLGSANIVAAQEACLLADPDAERCTNLRREVDEWCVMCPAGIRDAAGLSAGNCGGR